MLTKEKASPSHITLSEAQIEAMIARAAKEGARKALADIGLNKEETATDIKELNALLSTIRLAKKTMWQSLIRTITTALLVSLITGVAIKLKLFGGQ